MLLRTIQNMKGLYWIGHMLHEMRYLSVHHNNKVMMDLFTCTNLLLLLYVFMRFCQIIWIWKEFKSGSISHIGSSPPFHQAVIMSSLTVWMYKFHQIYWNSNPHCVHNDEEISIFLSPLTFPHTCICLYMIIILVKWFCIFNFLLIKNMCSLKFLILVHFYLFLTELYFFFLFFLFC